MGKRRVKWRVALYRYHFGKNKGKMYPRVLLRQTIDLEGVIDLVMAERSELRRDTLRSVAYQLFSMMEDLIVEGHPVATPLGTFTPTVNGMWNYNRYDPKARAENQASVNFALSKALKEALSNPLFQEDDRPDSNPRIYSILNMSTGATDGTLSPGDTFVLKGKLLLMNGDLPERGLYLLDKETKRQVGFIPAGRILINDRSSIYAKLPADIPPGLYRIEVASQCTTSPTPLKQVARGGWVGTVKVVTIN